jgi:hypothetical protein
VEKRFREERIAYFLSTTHGSCVFIAEGAFLLNRCLAEIVERANTQQDGSVRIAGATVEIRPAGLKIREPCWWAHCDNDDDHDDSRAGERGFHSTIPVQGLLNAAASKDAARFLIY